ncbi:MAG: hypothetical protein ACI4VQ_07525 [Clostridia bacterium]
MLIWNKKRLMFLLVATFLPIGIFITEMGYNNLKNKEIVSTMAVPVTNKTIVIDAGHGRRRWWSS